MPMPLGRKFFKLRKNKRFNYTPRYYDGKETGNVYHIENRYVKHRDGLNANDFGGHWREARQASRHRGNREVSTRLVIIIAVLILIFLYFIDFDLSIFTRGR
ncbi:MAG: hypothetical protein AAF611_11520 [Bacteroidota bacterium]